LRAAKLYRKEAKNQDTLDKYGHGTPEDWVERNVYSGIDKGGVALMLIVNILLFGPIGLTVWAVQMLWIPVTAAGVINGVGHYYGYRNFQVEDASTKHCALGHPDRGEELHNNHHAYASSARLSNKWYEFDIGWLYIRLMEIVGLAEVKKLAPTVKIATGKVRCDLQTLQGSDHPSLRTCWRAFTRLVKATCADELRNIRGAQARPYIDLQSVKRWLHLDAKLVPAGEAELEEV